MSNKPLPNSFTNEHQAQLFAAWLEDRLDENQRCEFEDLMLTDTAFSARVEACQCIMHQVDDFQPLDVPSWDKGKTYIATPKVSHVWWQWSGFPALSFGMSVLAVCLVLLKIDVQSGPDGVLVSFSGKGQEARIEQLVSQRLSAFEREQAAYLVDNVAQLRQEQQLAHTSTTQYLLSASREERREEFAEFIRFINQQRADDQLFYAKQFNQLEERIYPTLTNFDE